MGDFGQMENDRFIVKVPVKDNDKDSPHEYASILPTVYENESDLKLHSNGTSRLYPKVNRPYDSPPRPPKAYNTKPEKLATMILNGSAQPSAPPPSYKPSARLTRRVSQKFQRAYSAIEPQPALLWLFGTSVVQLVLGLFSLFAGVVLVVKTELNPQFQIYAGCWVSALYILAAAAGVVAARKGQQNYFTAALILAVLGLVATVILTVFSLANFMNAGRTHPLPHCIIHEHLAARISHIYQFETDYDYALCLWNFKIGAAMNAILAMFALFQGMLFLGTTVMLCTQLCVCTGYPCPTVHRRTSV